MWMLDSSIDFKVLWNYDYSAKRIEMNLVLVPYDVKLQFEATVLHVVMSGIRNVSRLMGQYILSCIFIDVFH